MSEPDDAIEEHEDLDAEQIVDDARELFGAPDRSSPASDADAPPPG
jgi:hypothetical protein